MLSVKEVAEKLGITTWMVNKLLNSGQLTGYKFGGLWRIEEDHLEEYRQGAINTGAGDEDGDDGGLH